MINTIASQALRGQSVKVTVAPTDIAEMQSLVIGQVMYSEDGLLPLGTVISVDYYGNSFKVIPLFNGQIKNFAFATIPGILSAGATVYQD